MKEVVRGVDSLQFAQSAPLNDTMIAPPPVRRGNIIPRLILVFAILAPLTIFLSDKLHGLDLVDIGAALQRISMPAIVLAVLMTGISFTAIAFYDVVALRLMRHSLPTPYVAKAGFTATALGQLLGFGLVVGTAVRWRFYRHYNISPASSGAISGFVSLTFMVALAILIAVSALLAPTALAELAGWSKSSVTALSFTGLGIGIAILVICYLQPRLKFRGKTYNPPRFRAVVNMLVLALCDVLPAATVLWVLMPADSAPSIAMLLPVYLAALGVGLLSNAPGGIGVLEAACIFALPHVDAAELMATLIAFRAIFYGLPFLVALGCLLDLEWRTGPYRRVRPDSERRSGTRRKADVLNSGGAGDIPAEVARLLKSAVRAEAGLSWAGDKSFLMSRDRNAMLMFAESGNGLVALSDPIGPENTWPALVDRFLTEARTRMVAPVFYKASQKFANVLRKKGLTVSTIGQEAIIDLSSYSTTGSRMRELRRKCASADKAGIQMRHHAPGRAPMAHLQRVSDQWVEDKGGRERGFSMGSFDRAYLAGFEILEATLDGTCIGFVSLWRSGDNQEWSIDVMRVTDDAPNGTMHALIHAAAMHAKNAGALRFSLCAVIFAGLDTPKTQAERVCKSLYAMFGNKKGLNGLYRFKQSFRPEWTPIYLASKTSFLPVSGAIAIRQLIEAKEPD